MNEGENQLLTRILDEIRGLRVDIKAIETDQGNHRERLTKLEVDLQAREKASGARTAYVCAFGAIVVTAVCGLVAMTYDNRSRIDSINSFGTAYGRGREDVLNARLERDERRLPKEDSKP